MPAAPDIPGKPRRGRGREPDYLSVNASIPVAEYRRFMGVAEPLEADFQASVIELAGVLGWLSYFTADSRQSPRGFPDLTMVRGDRLLFAELKRGRRKPTEPQTAWLEALGKAKRVSARVWRPAGWLEIEQALR